jgi:hypothetical protein
LYYKIVNNHNLPSLLLRIGLAGIYLYASIDSFLHPKDWVWYIPDWVLPYIDGELVLKGHAAGEFVLAIWLISGKWLKWAGLASAALMFGIFIARLDILNIVFRDFGIAMASLALAALHKTSKK